MLRSRRLATWLLVATFAATVPAFIFFFVVAGFVPVVAVLTASVSFPPFALLALPYLALYYVVARLITGILWRLAPPRMRAGVLVLIAGTAVWAAFQPIYLPVSHGSEDWVDIVRVLGLRRRLAHTPLAVRPTPREAIEDGDVPAAKRAILSARDPLAKDRYYMSPWVYAAEEGYVDVLEQLWVRLEGRIDPDSVEHAFFAAVERGQPDAVAFLLEKGVGPQNYDAALRRAAFHGNERIVDLLLERGAPAAPASLEVAAELGHLGIVEALVAHGADVNATALPDPPHRPPLTAAVDRRATSVVRFLLDHGADASLPEPNGRTALMVAAARGSADVIRLLLAAGANPNARDSRGRVALMYPFVEQASLPSEAALDALLDAGAEPNARDAEGRSMLSYAQVGDPTIDHRFVHLLEARGAQR